ncbi:MAG: hypothetical protein VZR36_04465 [Prevotella sp.]|nr:hypothetical protein [Prevotella sp.]
MKTGTFFSWFWILYLPFCILFYDRSGFQYIDEFMTLGLVIFSFIKKTTGHHIKKEIYTYGILMLFYVLYSLVMAINVPSAVFLDLQQQVRPYCIFYCTYLLAPTFTKKQQKVILYVYFVAIALFLLGLRLGVENATIGQACFQCGLLYIFFRGDKKKHLFIGVLIVTLGLLSGKSKFFGEYVMFIGLIFVLKNKFRLDNLLTYMQVGVLIIAIIFFTWQKFSVYYIEGMSEESSVYGRMARPESYKTASIIIFKDYIPFGTGLASFATNAAAKYYSPIYYKYGLNDIWGLYPENPMFLADAFFPTLAQYGMVGIIFFLWFWIRRYKDIDKINNFLIYRIALMCMLALFLEGTADTSYLSGKGMGYFMLLAMSLRGSYITKPKNYRIIESNVAKSNSSSDINIDSDGNRVNN